MKYKGMKFKRALHLWHRSPNETDVDCTTYSVEKLKDMSQYFVPISLKKCLDEKGEFSYELADKVPCVSKDLFWSRTNMAYGTWKRKGLYFTCPVYLKHGGEVYTSTLKSYITPRQWTSKEKNPDIFEFESPLGLIRCHYKKHGHVNTVLITDEKIRAIDCAILIEEKKEDLYTFKVWDKTSDKFGNISASSEDLGISETSFQEAMEKGIRFFWKSFISHENNPIVSIECRDVWDLRECDIYIEDGRIIRRTDIDYFLVNTSDLNFVLACRHETKWKENLFLRSFFRIYHQGELDLGSLRELLCQKDMGPLLAKAIKQEVLILKNPTLIDYAKEHLSEKNLW